MTPAHKLLGAGARKVVVLPGWFGDETLLDPLEPYIDLGGSTFAVLAYRGYGAARDVSGTYSIDEIVGDVVALADELGWDRFAIIGHSMGAKFALAVRSRVEDRVVAIVAITPVSADSVAFDEAGLTLFRGAASDVGKRAAIIAYSTGNRLTSRFAADLASASADRSDPVAFASYFEAWAHTDVPTRGDSTFPLMAIVGAQDPQLTEQVVRDAYGSRFPNARFVKIEEAGHYPIFETPVFLATTVQNFVDEAWAQIR